MEWKKTEERALTFKHRWSLFEFNTFICLFFTTEWFVDYCMISNTLHCNASGKFCFFAMSSFGFVLWFHFLLTFGSWSCSIVLFTLLAALSTFCSIIWSVEFLQLTKTENGTLTRKEILSVIDCLKNQVAADHFVSVQVHFYCTNSLLI